jgi:hypothetical protein
MSVLSALILPAMSATDLSVADPRQLLEARLDGMQWRRVLVAVLFFGAAALFIGLFVAQGGGFSAAAVIGWAFAVVFVLYGVLTCWQLATAEERNRRLVQLLDLDPGRIKRIYGTRMVRSGRYASMVPIKPPETESIGEAQTVCVVVELTEPSRVKRLLGIQKYIARVSPQELLELLGFLRGIAPDAQGPPGKQSS